MNIFDTHAHYDSVEFNENRDELLAVMPKNNVKYVINQGIDIESSLASIALAEKYDYIFTTVGIHPEEVNKKESILEIEKLAHSKKVVGIGEIGLDYYYDATTKDLQIEYFHKQLSLANKLNLPVVVHDRDAHKDVLDSLKNFPVNAGGVIHCYSGSSEMAKELIKLGYYLGFDGPVTFKNSKNSAEVLKVIPLDKILVETDAPYLTPEPFRGKQNNSMYLVHVINRIAEIRETSPEEIAEITFNNAKKLFKIDN